MISRPLRRYPRFRPQNFDRNLELVRRVDAFAKERGVTVGQLALAWVLAKGDDIIPIPGTRRADHLEQNVATADVVLSAEEIALIETALPAEEVFGDRYPDMSTVEG